MHRAVLRRGVQRHVDQDVRLPGPMMVLGNRSSPVTVSARSVTELLAKRLEVDRGRVVPTARLFDDLGATPLALIQVALALEERFDIQIAGRDVEDFVTVEDVMACVVRARNSRTSRPPAECSVPALGRQRSSQK